MSKKIIQISAECHPIAKVGCLADVAGTLPKYQNETGANNFVIMPCYDKKITQAHQFTNLICNLVIKSLTSNY